MNPTLRCLACSVFALLACSLHGQQTNSGSPLPATTKPTEKKTAKDDLASKEPYVVDLLQTKYIFEKDGRGSRETTARIEIKSESAVREFGLLVYSYASSFESIEVLGVRVHKPDGSTIDTPASEVQELDSAVSREAPMYTDQREKHIAVRSLGVGDVLESNIRWTIHDPLAPGHFWFDHAYFTGGSCLKEILEVNVPADLRISVRHAKPEPVIHTEGARKIYAFETSYHKPASESKIPDWEKNYHGIDPPDVQFSSFNDWAEVGAWFNDLIQPKAAVTSEIQAKADELTRGKTSEEEKIRAIYDFVSIRFRYIGIDLGMGRYSPHSAADVLTNRYGDCKDKHTLFAALLKASGISALPALISSRYKIDPQFPTPSLFDHVITAIPHEGTLQFIDTTPEVAPYGMLVHSLLGRETLLGTKPGRLVTTPGQLAMPNYEIFQVEGSLDEKGTFEAKMRLEERGEDEIVLRQAYRTTPQNRWQDLTQGLISRLGFGGTVSEVDVAQPEDTAHPFWITCNYHRTDYSEWKSHRITLPHPPIFMRELNDEQKLSKDPLPVGTPGEITFTSKVRFPAGYTPILPPAAERKNSFAEFSVKYSLDKDTLAGEVKFKTLKEEIPSEDREKFVSLAKTIEENESRYIYINGGGTAAAPLAAFGIFPPGTPISQLEAALDSDPDNDRVLLALSNAYLGAGRARDAVAVLQKKIDSGADVPPHLRLALGLAQLKIPDVDKAMVEFKQVLTDNAEPEEFNEAAYEMAEAKLRLPEALEYAKRGASGMESRTEEIDAEDATVDDFRAMSELAAIWDTVGWVNFQMGDAKTAEKYLKASWQVDQSAVVGEHLVEAYEKIGDKVNAAAICNMAKSAVLPRTPAKTTESLDKEIARLRPYIKREPGLGGPSAAHYVDGSFALSDMRLFEVPFHPKLSGKTASAEFRILLTAGPTVKDVRFVSGAKELHGAEQSLRRVKYPHSFPTESEARIIRKATLTCSVYTTNCHLILMPIPEAAVPVGNSTVVPMTIQQQ